MSIEADAVTQPEPNESAPKPEINRREKNQKSS